MGITGLKALIKKHAPDAIVQHPPSALCGKKLAIDTSIMCHQLGSVARSAHNDASRWRSFRRLAISRMRYYKTMNITPIFVFDGAPPFIKRYELDRRRATAEAAGTEPFITGEHFTQLRKIILAAGFQCVDAPSEAEAQCAKMCQDGIVDGVVTEDGDALTFGAHTVIFGFSNSARHVTIITLRHVLDGLGLTMDGFIDLCILLGCDYGPTLYGIGPVNALKYMRQYGSITKMLVSERMYVIPSGFQWMMPHYTFTDHETCRVVHAAPAPMWEYIATIEKEDLAASNAEADIFDD